MLTQTQTYQALLSHRSMIDSIPERLVPEVKRLYKTSLLYELYLQAYVMEGHVFTVHHSGDQDAEASILNDKRKAIEDGDASPESILDPLTSIANYRNIGMDLNDGAKQTHHKIRIVNLNKLEYIKAKTIVSMVAKADNHRTQMLSNALLLNSNDLGYIYYLESLNTYMILTNISSSATGRWDTKLCRILSLLPAIVDLDLNTLNKTGINFQKLISDLISNTTEVELTMSKLLEPSLVEIERLKLRKELQFIGNMGRGEVTRLKRKIESVYKDIRDYSSVIDGKFKTVNQYNVQLIAMQQPGYMNVYDEFMNYILDYKLDVIKDIEQVGDTKLRFTVVDRLRYFDEFELSVVKDKYSSRVPKIFQNLYDGVSAPRMIADIEIDLTECTVEYLGNSHYLYNGVANPHLYHYTCWSSNVTEIKRMLSDKNYVSALELIIAATMSVNFSDSVVISDFADDLYDNLNSIDAIDIETNQPIGKIGEN